MAAGCAVVGLYCSYYLDTATGAMMVLAQACVFTLVYLFGPRGLVRARARSRTPRQSQHAPAE